MLKRFPQYIFIGSLLSILWGFIVALDIVPQLRGDYGWRWPYEVPQHPERLLILGLSLTIYIIIGYLLIARRRAMWILLWGMLGCVTITLAIMYVRHADLYDELAARTISGGATGWHYAATDIDDVSDTMAEWPQFMARYEGQSSHMTTSPPGFPLIYYSISHVLGKNEGLSDALGRPLRAAQCANDRIVGYSMYGGYSNAELASAWFGILMPLWGALSIWPLYWVGKRFYGEKSARLSVLWWALVPSLSMFSPNPTPLYALMALVIIGLLAEGLRRQQPIWVLVAGLAASISTFFHFTILPIIFMAGLYTLFFHWTQPNNKKWYWPMMMGAWFGMGLASVWAIFYLFSGVGVWEIIAQSFNSHLSLERPYLPWVLLHLNDFFMFTGWPLVLLAGVGLWQIANHTWQRKVFDEKWILSFSAIFTLIVMDISGSTQGEAGRIWLFLAPFLVMIAAYQVSRSTEYSFVSKSLSVTLSQAIILIIMAAFMPVISAGLEKAPHYPPTLTEKPQTAFISSGAVYGDTFKLDSFTGYVEEGVLKIWLNWRSKGQVDIPYYVTFIAVSPSGQSATEAAIFQPFDAAYPMTCWLPESGVIKDYYEIPLEDSDIVGDWWVSMSMVNRDGTEKLAVQGLNGEVDTQIGLGPFKVLD